MSIPILATKLYIPPPRPNLVARPRLSEQLNEGLRQNGAFSRKLSLISAPAGFGKTTLVSSWLDDLQLASDKNEAVTRPQAAWLSLDKGDNEPARFLTYFIAALQTLALGQGEGTVSFGDEALEMLQSSPPAPVETLLTTLLNEIITLPDEFILVLDDYHVIDSQAIDHILTFLLEHLPPQLHLVITTREDPDLPLARYRVRGQLTELRAADLRFTPDEAATFLNQAMGLSLSAEEVASLESRTEGWIAGLQLAALSMRGREDVHGFIEAFAGDNRYIVDYLVEEVLQRQSEPVRHFLLQTSILDRLTGPLCDAVRFGTAAVPAGQEEGDGLLQSLERANLFVVPLDDRRQWYRYHHLFADVLLAHLLKEQPDRVPGLHQRASRWFEQSGAPADAVHHALAAADFERTADLVELAWPEMDRTFQTLTWLGWIEALPDELIRARPVLSTAYAWALLENGQPEAAEARLRAAESWLAGTAGTNEPQGAPAAETGPDQGRRMVVVDEEQFRLLPATIASARAYQAQVLGDVPGSVKYGQRALDLLPEEEYLRRGIVAALLGVAYWTSGELETAHHTLAEGMANMRLAGNLLFALRGTYVLADIRLAQGRLREAISTYEQMLQLAQEQGEQVLRGTADLYLRLSELHREQDNLAAAARHLRQSQELGQQAASPHWRYRLCLAQARLQEAGADLTGALDLLDEAGRHYVRGPVPDVRPIAALKTRLWLAQGKLAEALNWVHDQSLAASDNLSYLREFEHMTLARVLIASYQQDRAGQTIAEAMALLERLLQAAEAGGRWGIVIEILIVQALAHQAQGHTSLALAPLKRALALAEPEGYVHLFVDEGRPMADLLAAAAAQAIRPAYVARLLAVFEAEAQQSGGEASLPAAPSAQPLVEPLSERELEVLQLVAEGFSNREISQRLFLALSTVKGHNRNIYGKLQVQRRTEAVARARELGLL